MLNGDQPISSRNQTEIGSYIKKYVRVLSRIFLPLGGHHVYLICINEFCWGNKYTSLEGRENVWVRVL